MKSCVERAQLLEYFKQPGRSLSPELADHLGTCPDCVAAVGEHLDKAWAMTQGSSRVRLRKPDPLLEDARRMMHRELGIS